MALTAWTEAQRALIGSLMLDPDLEPGYYRELTKEEWKLLER